MSPRMHCLDPDLVALMRNPTVEGAMGFYEPFRRKMGWPYPIDATPEVAALACVHKARVRWSGSTKSMVRASKAWLVEHGMSRDITAAPNLRIQ